MTKQRYLFFYNIMYVHILNYKQHKEEIIIIYMHIIIQINLFHIVFHIFVTLWNIIRHFREKDSEISYVSVISVDSMGLIPRVSKFTSRLPVSSRWGIIAGDSSVATLAKLTPSHRIFTTFTLGGAKHWNGSIEWSRMAADIPK